MVKFIQGRKYYEKNYISKNTKKLMFIPLVNVFNILIWGNNCSTLPHNRIIFLKSLFILFGIAILWGILGIILSSVFESDIILDIYGYIGMYLFPLSISFALIKYQKKLNIGC